MRRSILAVFVTAICTAAAAEDHNADSDLFKQAKAEQRALAKASSSSSGVTAADVGDVDSFGRNVHFLGVTQSGTVTVSSSCPPPDPAFPDDRCVVAVAPPGTTAVQARDIGRIHLPARAASSLLCHSITAFPLWQFSNGTGGPGQASFSFTTGVTVESEVLNDPSLIDPNTGLPFNGAFDVAFNLIVDRQTIQPGDLVQRRQGFTRGCVGGLVSKQGLMQVYGLTAAQADDFFKKPMTLRLNATLSTRFSDNTFVFFGLRVLGD
jgi:hypothetical protein